MKWIFFLILTIGGLGLAAQNQQGLIYGEIITVTDQRYRGLIRWDIEEAFWDDSFSAIKVTNESLSSLEAWQIKRLRDKEPGQEAKWDFMSLWENPYPSYRHVFRGRFGDLQKIDVTGAEGAIITFRDGSRMSLDGGGDVGRRIYVYESADEFSRLEWDRIDEIIFQATPSASAASSNRVSALYGTVFTTQGAFEGYIQWDNEECLSTDMMDGKSGEKLVKIPFGEIAEIKVEDEGEMCRVSLFNGRTYRLGETDDLGKRNHGIVVKNLDLGRVVIPWTEFRFARFVQKVPDSGPAYDAFPPPNQLRAKVVSIDGKQWEGELTFDLDIRLDLEMLIGEQDGLVYYLPFRNLARIERRNHKFCAVSLKNGDKLFLGESRQLTDENWGLLIRTGEEKPVYVPWAEVDYLQFE